MLLYELMVLDIPYRLDNLNQFELPAYIEEVIPKFNILNDLHFIREIGH